MNNDRIHLYLEDMSIRSDYEILDHGKHKDEIEELTKKREIKTPSKDLAFFKCKYAMVDEENRNGCILPRKEVEKAINSLNFKAIDKDHLRQKTVGMWLDAKLVKGDVIAYGGFWKSNFPDEYEEIKKRMTEGKMKISFEAWGNRKFNEDGSYNLIDIEFAGGALLFDTEPAFPDAEVIEFSQKNRILEFAKIIEEVAKKKRKCNACNGETEYEDEKNWIKCITCAKMINKEGNTPQEQSTELYIEEARLLFDADLNNIARTVYNHKCPTCDSVGWQDVLSIDFENSKIKHKCYGCGEVSETDMTPDTVIKKKGKKPEPIKEESIDTIDKIDKSKEVATNELQINVDKKEDNILMDEILKKYNKASIEEVVKSLEVEVETHKSTIVSKEQELATLKTEKDAMSKTIEDTKLIGENAKIELEKVKAEYATIKADLDKRIADEKAAIVKSRKEILGEEYSKDLSDEDILNDLKFENSKLKKERDEALKKAGISKGGLDGGAIDTKNKDEAFVKQDNVHTKAFK